VLAREQLEREQSRTAAGGAGVFEPAAQQLLLLPEAELPDRAVGGGPFEMVLRPGLRLELVGPGGTQLREIAFVPALRESVCLDPGHGGKDPGNEEGRRQEKEYALLLAREVRERLTAAGLKTTLTRNGDSFVPLSDRPEIARQRDADLFVSLHFNAAIAEKDVVQGVEVYCLTPAGASSTNARGDPADTGVFTGNRCDAKNMLLAYQIQKAMVIKLPAEDRGVKRARFAVLRTARVPAVLIEAGFMSHPAESKNIFNAEYRRQLARAIADGILAYKRLVER
jgi:N-acetylmuramoyl-L-alanine amidase